MPEGDGPMQRVMQNRNEITDTVSVSPLSLSDVPHRHVLYDVAHPHPLPSDVSSTHRWPITDGTSVM